MVGRIKSQGIASGPPTNYSVVAAEHVLAQSITEPGDQGMHEFGDLRGLAELAHGQPCRGRSNPIIRRLQHRAGELLEQPVRPGQGQSSSRANRTSSLAAVSSSEGPALSFLGRPSSVINGNFPLTSGASDRKHP
jgi:hypothetical protein